MPAELIVAPEAGQDIADAYSWYEDQRGGLGEEFLSCVDACIEAICRLPEMHAVIHENYRKNDDLRPEYDLSRLKGGIRGKYYRQATARTNLVLVDPEIANVFPDTESVNRALCLLVDTAKIAAPGMRSQLRAE